MITNDKIFCIKDIINQNALQQNYTFIGNFDEYKCFNSLNKVFNSTNVCNYFNYCNIINLPSEITKLISIFEDKYIVQY